MNYHFVSNNMGFVIQHEMLPYTLKRTAGFCIKFHFIVNPCRRYANVEKLAKSAR